MVSSKTIVHIGYFVTSHGYGHASRAAAVMAAIQRQRPGVWFHIFTTSPPWIFGDSLAGGWTCHRMTTDIGLVQRSPFEEDLPATIDRLNRWLPFSEKTVGRAAAAVSAHRCELVVCDISPLGIAAARQAGVPSVLVENFTWDWIYRHYGTAAPDIIRHADTLAAAFRQVDVHIRATPGCSDSPADQTVPPISRSPRETAGKVRSALGIPAGAHMVLVSLGGVADDFQWISRASLPPQCFFVMPGARGRGRPGPQSVLLPAHSKFYHPDLVHAADAMIGKVGYSTLAEVYAAGVPFGYIGRRRFAESGPLSRFIEQHMAGRPISQDRYHSGRWLTEDLPALLAMPRRPAATANGADQVADRIAGMLG